MCISVLMHCRFTLNFYSILTSQVANRTISYEPSALYCVLSSIWHLSVETRTHFGTGVGKLTSCDTETETAMLVHECWYQHTKVRKTNVTVLGACECSMSSVPSLVSSCVHWESAEAEPCWLQWLSVIRGHRTGIRVSSTANWANKAKQQ